jgi:hypothetical protein
MTGKFRITETADLYEVVSRVMEEDDDLFARYHYESPTSYEEATSHTCHYIAFDTPTDAEFLSIEYNGELVGFFCSSGDTVWDFAVKQRFRGSVESMKNVWGTMFARMSGPISIRLCERNHRDINFLLRHMGATALDFNSLKRKMDYAYMMQEGAIKGKEKHVFFLPLSQIILKFEHKENDGDNAVVGARKKEKDGVAL